MSLTVLMGCECEQVLGEMRAKVSLSLPSAPPSLEPLLSFSLFVSFQDWFSHTVDCWLQMALPACLVLLPPLTEHWECEDTGQHHHVQLRSLST